jgi:TatD DNase family protein
MRQQTTRRREGEAPPAPAPLAVPVLDSHTHLDLIVEERSADEGRSGVEGAGGGLDQAGGVVDEAIAQAAAVGVTRLVQVGVDVGSSRWGAQLAERSPAVLATVALHPNEAPRLFAGGGAAGLDAALREIEALAALPRVRGLGETGLDTFRTGDEGRAAQDHSFRAHIGFAKATGKPLMIHDRDAHADVLRVLDSEGAPDTVVLHCFSGDEEFARECVRRGYVLSFAGTVTFKNAQNLRDAARITPPEQLLVETDAPFLTPTPHRGRPNSPYLIPLTVRALAQATGRDLDELCASIAATGERVFGPW